MELETRRRDLVLFLAGPVAICALSSLVYRGWPWATPFPGQAALLDPFLQTQWLLYGATGIVLAPLVGISPTPSNVRGWIILVVAAVVPGAALGALQLASDYHFHLTETAGRAMGVTWANVALPGSIPMSATAAVMLECWYRLAPIPFLVALVSGVLLRGKHQTVVFWTVALLTSLIEPSQQIGPALKPGQPLEIQTVLLAMTASIFAFNLFEAFELKRWGWPAPILLRLGFYGAFHALGPYLLPSNSFLFPGPH